MLQTLYFITSLIEFEASSLRWILESQENGREKENPNDTFSKAIAQSRQSSLIPLRACPLLVYATTETSDQFQ